MNTTNSESLRRISVAILLSSIHLFGAQPADTGDQAPSINDVLRQIDQYVYRGMAKTHVPGVAVGIVYRDRVVYLKGFGVRKEGESAAINTGTVFQLASLSKPLASTVIASLVGSGDVSWDDRIAELDPRFALSDRSVTERLTIRDLLSHRSGLPTSAGDALEDLGFTRPEILRKMRLLALPGEFRKTYKYSNFGF